MTIDYRCPYDWAFTISETDCSKTAPVTRTEGWATCTELSYSVNYQETLSYGGYSGKRHYLQLPDGTVLRVSWTSGLTPYNRENAG